MTKTVDMNIPLTAAERAARQNFPVDGLSISLWFEQLTAHMEEGGLIGEAAARSLFDDVLRLREALENIALLDEADGHELTVEHAMRAVAIATSTLGMHPSEILVRRGQQQEG